MATAAALYSFLSAVLVLALAATGLLRLARLDPIRARIGGLALAAVLSLPPLSDFGAGASASLFAPFAPGAALVAGLILARPFLPAIRPASRIEQVVAGGAALLFYAASLGVARFDPHALFLQPGPAVALSGAMLAAGFATGRPLLALLAPAGLAVWLTGLNGSENAADALLHPVMLLALVPALIAPASPSR
jgi:hypothetical protein